MPPQLRLHHHPGLSETYSTQILQHDTAEWQGDLSTTWLAVASRSRLLGAGLLKLWKAAASKAMPQKIMVCHSYQMQQLSNEPIGWLIPGV